MPNDRRIDNPDELPAEFKEWLLRYLDQERSLPVVARLASGGANTYSVSNSSTDRTYDVVGITVGELANVVATIISDLRQKGIVG